MLPLHGWRSLPKLRRETLALALYVHGVRLATVEVYESTGPYYAYTDHERFGAGASLAKAISWCERKTGFREDDNGPAKE